jgi:hypothetical protein
MRPVTPRARSLATLLLALLLGPPLGSCGGEDGGSRVDRSNFSVVFDAAMEAVSRRDLDRLWVLLTPAGQVNVERSLLDWQQRLNDPSVLPLVLERIRERRVEVPEGALERAQKGGLKAVWDFFLRVDPRPARPRKGEIRFADSGRAVEVLYEDPTGAMRPVRLVQTPRGWYVDDLQL